MARIRSKGKPTQVEADATTDSTSATNSVVGAASAPGAVEASQQAQKAASSGPSHPADPHEEISVRLCEIPTGPSMHLLRSHRFRQMQIRFDHGQPDEHFLAILKRAGWTDRSESEGAWTKQIDPNARWQSVRDMEHEFKEVANAIRTSKGLEPALAGLSIP
jgi:hypothetical protein